MNTILVNAVGEACPLPVIKAKKALEDMRAPGILSVLVDNEIAVQNLLRLAESRRPKAVSEKTAENAFSVRMELTGLPQSDAAGDACACATGKRSGALVAVGTDAMGSGDDTLGKTLMKGFLYALGQLDELPATLLFYNGGARLTSEGSASLEDLRALETAGVEILTCGTCLNFYGLSDRLAVGAVTNMYTIVEKLSAAEKIIRP